MVRNVHQIPRQIIENLLLGNSVVVKLERGGECGVGFMIVSSLGISFQEGLKKKNRAEGHDKIGSLKLSHVGWKYLTFIIYGQSKIANNFSHVIALCLTDRNKYTNGCAIN